MDLPLGGFFLLYQGPFPAIHMGLHHEGFDQELLHNVLHLSSYDSLPIALRNRSLTTIRLMEDPSFQFLQAAYLKAEQLNCSVLDGVRAFKIEAGMHELSLIKQSGAVYFNSSGGCTSDISYTQFCRRKELIFPDFTEKDLRYVRYPNGGRHWYVFIGDMQVKDGMRSKWNTREEAERIAKKVLNAQ